MHRIKEKWSSFDYEKGPYSFPLLTTMIVTENLIAAEILLSLGADVNHESESDNRYYTPLIIATTMNNPTAVKLLLNYKVEVDLKLFGDKTTLWKAAELGFSEIVSILLSAKANPNARNKHSEQTALYIAASKNHVEVVRLLLDAKADTELPDSRGFTPLIIASENGYYEVVSLLLSRKADPNKKTAQGLTALCEAASSGHLAVATLLLDHHADPNSNLSAHNLNLSPCDDFREMAERIASTSPLDYAIRHNHKEIADLIEARGGKRGKQKPKLPHPFLTKRLLEEIFSQHAKSYFTHLPESITTSYLLPMTVQSIEIDRDAYSWNNDETAELIASLNSATLSGEEKSRRCIEYKKKWAHLDQIIRPYNFSLLTSMIIAENLIAAEILLTHGANVNLSSSFWSYTPLIIASKINNPAAIQLLIKYNAEVDLTLYDDTTALWNAAELGFSEIVSILLSANADPNARDNCSKQTALYRAASGNHVEVVRHLLDAKADTSIPDSRGVTPLAIASENRHYEVVSLLLGHNVDPNTPLESGDTPLSLAAGKGHLAVATLLLNNKSRPYDCRRKPYGSRDTPLSWCKC